MARKTPVSWFIAFDGNADSDRDNHSFVLIFRHWLRTKTDGKSKSNENTDRNYSLQYFPDHRICFDYLWGEKYGEILLSWGSNFFSLQLCFSGFSFGNTWKCVNIFDGELSQEMTEIHEITWIFLILRIMELFETIFFILRKKRQQLT